MIQINGPAMDSAPFSQDNRSPYSNAPQNFGRVKTSKSLLQSYASAPQMNYPGFQAPSQPAQQMPYFVKPPAASPIHSYQNQNQQPSFQDNRLSPPFVHRQMSPGVGSQHSMSPHVSFKFSPSFNDRQYPQGAQALGGQMQFQGQQNQNQSQGQNLLQQQYLGPYDSSPQLYNVPQQVSRQNSYSSSSHS
eukprot:gene25093-31508_t